MLSEEERTFLDMVSAKGYLDKKAVDYILQYYQECERRGRPVNLIDYFVLQARFKRDFSLNFEQIAEIKSLCLKQAKSVRELAETQVLADQFPVSVGPKASTAAREQFRPGDTFAHYRIDAELGRGGMGVVYRVYDTRLERTAALKVLLRKNTGDEIQLQRFIREARSVARINHPHIIRVFDVGEQPEPYFTMEYIAGQEFSRLIKEGAIKPLQAAKIVRKVADALEAVHQQGITHRDIKPSNIILDNDGEPKLMDFGLAKTDDTTLSRTGEIMGTPSYMSPEQVNKKRANAGSDIYSLGATLYQALTGREPFQGDSVYNVIFQICNKDPIPPRMLNPDIAQDLESICLKCLEKKPEQRYASAHLLGQDLQNFLERRPVMAKPATGFTRAQKWVVRNKAVTSVTLGSASIVLFVLIFFIWHQHRRQAELTIVLRNEVRARQEAKNLAIQAEQAKSEAKREKEVADEKRIEAQHARELAEQARVKVEQKSYYACIGLADKYREEHNTTMAASILAECPEEMRHWEWHWITHELCSSPYLLVQPECAQNHSCAFSPDGTKIAVAGERALWVATGKEQIAVFQKGDRFSSCAFSPDGNLIVAAAGKNLVLMATATGEIVRTFPDAHRREIHACAFSPDGKFIASAGDDHQVKLWTLSRGEPTTYDPKIPVYFCQFSPDSTKLLFTCSDSSTYRLELVDVGSGKTVKSLKRSGARIAHCSFSPNGRKVVFGGDDNTVHIWEWEADRLATLTGHHDNVKCCWFSPDGKIIASASDDDSVKIWNAGNGALLYTLLGHKGNVNSCAFSPDGNTLASVSDDGLRVWDLPASVRPQESMVTCCAFSGDGKKVATAGDAGLSIWDSAGNLLLTQPLPGTRSLAFTPDNRMLVTATYLSEIELWDAQSGKRIRSFTGHQGPVNCCAVSPDQNLLATGGNDRVVRLWSLSKGKLLATLEGHGDDVEGCAFSPDGRRLMTVSDDDTVKTWDVAAMTLDKTLRGHNSDVICCAFYPKGDSAIAVTGSEDNTLRLWNLDTGAFIVLEGHSGYVQECAFSPDGKRLVSASEDATLKLWDAEAAVALLRSESGRRADRSIRPLLMLKGHTESVYGCVFSPDGKSIVSVSGDRTIKMWQAPGGY